MLRRLHWLILRRLPGPFFGWLGILMFLLLMQFLIRWLPEIAGKGIPVLVIMELIVYNLAYMVVLAVPMSVLLAALMAFGGLAESKYYTVIKSTGISFGEIVWPALLISLLVGGGLLYFNNVLLPEANYRARQLWSDIRNKRPGFELQPGVFYDGVDDYSILVQERPAGTNQLKDVTIYDYTQGRDEQAVIKANRGRITSQAGGGRMTLTLYNGEMHRPRTSRSAQVETRYEQLQFNRHVIHFDLSDAVFQRSNDDENRSTRTTPIGGLLKIADSLQTDLQGRQQKLRSTLAEELLPERTLAAPDTSSSGPSWIEHPDTLSGRSLVGLANVDSAKTQHVVTSATRHARSLQSEIEDVQRDLNWKQKRLRSYQVEIHKKFSIAVACFIFMIIGAPLGLALRRGGLATIGVIALGIFMFYWITLVQGEKLSERGFFPPWLGMWIANIVMSGAGLWLLVYVVLDLGATPPLRRRLWEWLRSFTAPPVRPVLYLVPTPIGNLDDITYRAVRTLREVDLIACEDTRTSGVLLSHYDIDTPTTAYHEHNEHDKTSHLVKRMRAGHDVAVISDAGSPGISDPGFYITRACWEADVPVEALPGPTALIPALTASGLPCDRFAFEGFLPKKKGRQTRLQTLASEPRTLVLYESPHRLLRTLDDLGEHMGPDRRAAVARELTKKFEEIERGTLASVREYFGSHENLKGECVIVVDGAD